MWHMEQRFSWQLWLLRLLRQWHQPLWHGFWEPMAAGHPAAGRLCHPHRLTSAAAVCGGSLHLSSTPSRVYEKQ